MTGELVVGAVCVPLEFHVDVAKSESTLDITAVVAADHTRLGVFWVPAGPLRAPTDLVVRARLVPITHRSAPRSIAVPRGRPERAVNANRRSMRLHTAVPN